MWARRHRRDAGHICRTLTESPGSSHRVPRLPTDSRVMDTYRTEPVTNSRQPAADHWRHAYRAERTKARILGATTVAASLLAVGAGAWGLSNADSGQSAGQVGGPTTSQFGPPGTAPGGSPAIPPGGGQGTGQDLAALLFNSDGSVNATAVEQFLSRMPGSLDEFLTIAVQNGDLTQDQADLIAQAASDSSSTSPTSSEDI